MASLHTLPMNFSIVVLIALIRASVVCACLVRLGCDFQASRRAGRTRVGAWLTTRRRHAAVPLVLYLVVDAASSAMPDPDEAMELRLVLLALWAGRLATERTLVNDPIRRERLVDAAVVVAPLARAAGIGGGLAAFLLRSPLCGSRVVASRAVLCGLDGGAFLGSCGLGYLAHRMAVPVRRALRSPRWSSAERAAAVAAVDGGALAALDRERPGALALAALEAQGRVLRRLGLFCVLAGVYAAAMLELHGAEASGLLKPGLPVESMGFRGTFSSLYAAALLGLPLFWCVGMRPLFRDGPKSAGPEAGLEGWERWQPVERGGGGPNFAPFAAGDDALEPPPAPKTASPPRDAKPKRSGSVAMPRRGSGRPPRVSTAVELEVSLEEMVVVDELACAPVAALFAGRDTFLVVYERRRPLRVDGERPRRTKRFPWREVARSEVARNETDPAFAVALRIDCYDDEELELGFAVGNLCARDSGKGPEPEWAGYAEGYPNGRDAPPVRMETEDIGDHVVVGHAVIGGAAFLKAAQAKAEDADPFPALWRPARPGDGFEARAAIAPAGTGAAAV